MALYETSENSCYSDFGAQDLRSSPLRVRARHLDVTVRLCENAVDFETRERLGPGAQRQLIFL